MSENKGYFARLSMYIKDRWAWRPQDQNLPTPPPPDEIFVVSYIRYGELNVTFVEGPEQWAINTAKAIADSEHGTTDVRLFKTELIGTTHKREPYFNPVGFSPVT